MTINPLSWLELETLANTPSSFQLDPINGATNAQARLRLFGQDESAVRVTLYRDHHAWCPYCQKIWLWLEEKQIPYRIKKVTMFCYGEKESWYKQKVRSGMLPAVEIDDCGNRSVNDCGNRSVNDRIITESDDILLALEKTFGPLVWGMTDSKVLPLRKLERLLFRAWCEWLCRPARDQREEQHHREQFLGVVSLVEEALGSTPSPYFLEEFSTADVIFTPYVERMSASLYYYKGYSLREENSHLGAWFAAMESRSTYRGTQSDFHTHAHDLPPQMGGCWSNNSPQTLLNQVRVDQGSWFGLPDVMYQEPETSRSEALQRVLKHHQNIIRVNPADDGLMDMALRCALTNMMTGEDCPPLGVEGADVALRYLRNRISVPRDMSIYAAKRLRESLEKTAELVGDRQSPPLPTKHRRDQDPANFAR